MPESDKSSSAVAIFNPNEVIIRLNKETREYERINVVTGEVVAAVRDVDKSGYVFDKDIAMAICNAVRDGLGQLEISKLIGLPTDIIRQWRAFNKQFDREWRVACKERAEIFHDKAVQILKDIDESENDTEATKKLMSMATVTDKEGNEYVDHKLYGMLVKERMDKMKFQFSSYLKLAAKGNPDVYEAKPAVAASVGPNVIMINTGLPSTRIGNRAVSNDKSSGNGGVDDNGNSRGGRGYAQDIEADYTVDGGEGVGDTAKHGVADDDGILDNSIGV